MIAAEKYKRAAYAAEPATSDRQHAMEMAGRTLRASWALSRVPAIPSPHLAERLALALIEVCGRDRAIAVQIGRMDSQGVWRAESWGLSGRLRYAASWGGRPSRCPWADTLPHTGAPAFLVCRPNAEHPAFQGIAGRLRSVELALEAAGIASGCGPRGVVVTVQMGGLLECHRSGNDFGRCTLLGQLLPWVHAIVRAALDGREGDAPRSWLTAREMIVLEKLIDGGSVAEIAQQLGRSRYTVHDQVKSLHRKLGVRTRAALVCCATRGVDPPTVGNPSSVVS